MHRALRSGSPTTPTAELPSQLDDQRLKYLGAQPLFDVDGADLFTQWLLLRVLMEAAPSPKLPYYLHGQVALAPMMGRRATLRQ
jgi:hypothetical protein